VRSNLFCRICKERETHTGAPPTPPISELERKYHDVNHAIGAPPDRSRGLSGFSATISWDDVERQVAHYKNAR
jgi:hypothetical protein